MAIWAALQSSESTVTFYLKILNLPRVLVLAQLLVSAYCSIEIHYYTIKEHKQIWTSENTAAVAPYMINYRQTHLQ